MVRSLVLVFVCLFATTSSAQSTKISGELVRPVGGSVTFNYRVTPDGTRVVYQADQDVDEDYEVYSVPLDGSAPSVRLSGAEGDVPFQPAFEISDDSSHVAYMAVGDVYFVPTDGSTARIELDTPTPGISVGDTDPFFRIAPGHQRLIYWNEGEGGIYSTPTDGGPGVSLSGITFVPGDFRFSPDGSRVFYRRDPDFAGFEVFNAAIDGSGELSLGDADRFELSPDGTRVVYRQNGELFSRLSDGSDAPVPVHPSLASGGFVIGFAISPDGQRVVMTADTDNNTVSELFSAPIDGSAAALRINGPLVPGGDVGSFSITADSRRVVYLADQETDDTFELYSARIDRSFGRFKVSGRMVSGGDVFLWQLTPDGRRVVYRADQDTNDVFELYSASVDQDTRPRLRRVEPLPIVKLNGPLGPDGDVEFGFSITADSRHVVFRADPTTDQMLEVFAARVDGVSPAVRLNDDLVPGTSVLDFRVGDGRAAFRTIQTSSAVDGYGLCSATLDGLGSPTPLNPPLPPGPVAGDVLDFQVAPDGTRTLYLADQDMDGVDELYSVPTRGGATPTKLNGPLLPDRDVIASGPRIVELSPAGTHALYRSDEVTDGVFELFVVPLDGSAAPLSLSNGLDVSPSFAFSADGARVAFLTADGATPDDLYSAPADGSAPPVRLNPTLVAGRNVVSFEISPDAANVVYTSNHRLSNRFELFSVPLDGSAASIRLSGTLPGGAVASPRGFTPDGAALVYQVVTGSGSGGDAFVVPTDGSAAALRLNEVTNPGRNVFDVRLAPDGSRALFVADQDTDDVFELFSVPLDGSATPVKLSPDPVPGGNMTLSYAISPDSSRVVFLGDFETDETVELFSALIVGGTPAARLSGPMVAGGDVGTFTSTVDFVVTPDSRRVVYLADQELDGTVELFSVGIAGARAPVKLNGELTPFGDVRDFALGAGGRVAYVANQDDLSTQELYGVPVQGNGEVEKLSGPMLGNVQTFQFSSRGRVVYRADQEMLSVFELYSSRARRQALREEPPTAVVLR